MTRHLCDPVTSAHLDALADTLAGLRSQAATLNRWAAVLATRLGEGGRLLAAGNGGSAAEAQHLTAELVGRFRADRRPFSALALCSETSSLTAIGNDYGYDEVFARQVTAHGRQGDVLVLLSTSGHSRNLLRAAEAGDECGLTTWAFTGPAPNPLADAVHEAVCLPGAGTNVQEAQLVAVHLLCTAFEAALSTSDEAGRPVSSSRRAS
jgi:phosphoheptose isomerase